MRDEVRIKLTSDNQVGGGVTAATRELSTRLGGLGRSLRGALGFSALMAGAKKVIGYVDNIGDAAERVDMDPGRYQVFARVAELAGIKAEVLDGALMRIATAQDAVGKDEKVQRTFKALGLSIEDVINSNPEELLERMAQGFAKTGDRSAVLDLIGKRAGGLIPVFQTLANQGWDKLSEGIEGIIDKETIDQVSELEGKLTNIKKSLVGWAAGGILKVVNGIQNAAAGIGAVTAGGTIADAAESRIGEMDAKDKRQETAKAERELTRQAAKDRQREQAELSAKVKSIEDANDALSEQGDIQKRNMEDFAQETKQIEYGFNNWIKAGTFDRLAGRGDQNQLEAADDLMRRATDRGYRREEERKDKQIEKDKKRWEKKVDMARKGLFRGPLGDRIRGAEEARVRADATAKSIEDRCKKIEEAQLDATNLLRIIEDNTRELKWLKKSLQIGGGET